MIGGARGLQSARPLLARLEQAGVPASPINTIGEMFADPQTMARGMRLDLDDGHGNALALGARADAAVEDAACL